MSDTQEEFEVLLSGYLDGELDAAQLRRFESLVAERPSRRQEVDSMRRLFAGANSLYAAGHPPDDTWDTFLDDVYNRLERRFGWVIFVGGVAVLSVLSLYVFITEPWGPALLKVALATPVVGLGIVFLSVLRNRMHTIKTDRYEREVHR